MNIVGLFSGSGKMNLNNVKVPKMPGGGAASALVKLGVIAGLGVYGVANSLYNVEGGHRAIVFNRVVGVKDKVFLPFVFLSMIKFRLSFQY